MISIMVKRDLEVARLMLGPMPFNRRSWVKEQGGRGNHMLKVEMTSGEELCFYQAFNWTVLL